MAIDLEREEPITFDQAAPFLHLPPGTKPSYCSWWRWYRHGIRGIRLETVKLMGRRLTTAAAVQRFLTAVAAASSGEDCFGHQKAASRHRFGVAEKQLEREGI